MMGRSHDQVMIEYFRANPAYAASLVNDILANGDRVDDVLAAYPAIAREDVSACLAYASGFAKGYCPSWESAMRIEGF